jgi:CxxC-x17-CxxC domain-containing protein
MLQLVIVCVIINNISKERGNMKKRFKHKSLLAVPQGASGVAGLIDKVQQQLNLMEKKLDILISQSSKRPFEKSYSHKPSQRFSYSHRHDGERQGSAPGARTYTRVVCADCNKECEIPFKPSTDRPVYCKECFPKHKKGGPFNASRDNRFKERDFPRKRRFDKRRAGKSQNPVQKKKSFPMHRKQRA